MNIENTHEQLRILPDKKAKFDTRRNPKQRAMSNLDQCAVVLLANNAMCSCPKCFKKKPSLQKEKKDWAVIELEER